MARANGRRFTRAALLDRGDTLPKSSSKIATILGPHSGVGWKRLLGGVVRE